MVSAAHWLTPKLAFLAQMRTFRVGIWIVIATVTIDFSNQKTSRYILVSQEWSMIAWWISNARYSEQALRVLDISSRVILCGSSGEEGVSKVL